MNNFDIFVDSGANIPDELVKKHNIGVIPYSCTVNGEERLCYDENTAFAETAKKFYDDLRNGADVKTSLISMARITEHLTPSLEKGKDVVLLTISSALSGTHNQAVNAKEELEKKFPDCKIYVFDSANASMGSGLLALKIADLRDMGESAESCAEWLNLNAYKINSYVTVGDLKYLRKGGRVSAVAAIAGTLLNIKPILHANDTSPAKLTVVSKERGRKKALASLANAYSENAENKENETAYICHADCESEAEELAAMVKERGAKDVVIGYYDLCTGSHVGPDTIALFFYGKDRRAAATESERQSSGKFAKFFNK